MSSPTNNVIGNAFLRHIAQFCVHHKKLVLIGWAILVIGVVVLSGSVGSAASDNISLPGTQSQQAANILQKKFPSQANGSSPLVIHARQGTLLEPKNMMAVQRAVAAGKRSPLVQTIVSPYNPAAPAVNRSGKTGYISVTLRKSIVDYTPKQVQTLVDQMEAPLQQAGLESAAGGLVGQRILPAGSDISELIGILAAIIILLLTFGSAVSMMMPIVTAIVGLITSLSVITLLSHVMTVPTVAPILGAMLGLGVGIDYALFLVSRHRQQLAEGMDENESIIQAVSTTGGAVLFAGITVIIAICSLAIAGIPIVSAMGFMAAVAVLFAILSALTFLPALLAVLGPRIDHWRLPWLHQQANQTVDHDHSRWAKWAAGVAKRPWGSIVAAMLILGVLAIPTFSLVLGQANPGQGPKNEQATQAYQLLTEGFGPGVNGPVLLTATLPSSDAAAKLLLLRAAISKERNVVLVSPPQLNAAKDTAIITVMPKTGPAADATAALVQRLRHHTIPKLLAGSGVTVYVGGATAGNIDLADNISDSLPELILVVILLSFLVLLLAFRSIAIPVQAAVMNLLGVAASYGVIVAVFQWGWLSSMIGVDGIAPIVSFVPLMMFAILFGLSMDYEVFLVSHIQEEYSKSGDNRQAVIRGLSQSAKVITAAALIMFCVFGSFVLNPDPTVKQFGLGLAFAIAIDATVIRCLLVPALMVLLGRRNWWLPKWLERALPHMSIEGKKPAPVHEPAG